MVDIKSRKCRTQGCGKGPLFGVAGTTTAEYCAQHAPYGMVDVCRIKCRTENCGKEPSFGVAKGVLCAARTGRDGQRQEKKVQNPRLRKGAVVRSGRYKNGGVLCTACTGRDGRHQEQKVQNPRLRKGAIVWRGRYNNGGVLCTARQTTIRCRKEQDREVGPHHFWKETIGNAIPSGAKHTTVHPLPTKTSQTSGVSPDSHKRVRHPDVTSTMSKRAIARKSTAGAVTMPDIDGQKFPFKRNSSVTTEVQLSL